MPKFYLNETHKKQVELAIRGQSSQPIMSHDKAAKQYNRIMKGSPTALDPTAPKKVSKTR